MLSAMSKLWSELSKAERETERREFIADFVAETGCTEAVAALQWEQYLNQEGYTARDERILVLRDAAKGGEI
jgi:hypothetical protein